MELLKHVNDFNTVYTSAAQVNERYQYLFNHGYSDLQENEQDMIIRTVLRYIDRGTYVTGANLLEAIDAFHAAKKEVEIERGLRNE